LVGHCLQLIVGYDTALPRFAFDKRVKDATNITPKRCVLITKTSPPLVLILNDGSYIAKKVQLMAKRRQIDATSIKDPASVRTAPCVALVISTINMGDCF